MGCVVGFIRVLAVCMFLDVLGVVRRVISMRIVVRGGRGYVSFAVSQLMLIFKDMRTTGLGYCPN